MQPPQRKTVEWNIPCLTSIDTANAIAASIRSKYTESTTEIVDINNMRTEKQTFEFTKMQGCGNDYMMTPRKSVTAILGVSGHPVKGKLAGCGHCVLRTRCEYRKRGKTCASE